VTRFDILKGKIPAPKKPVYDFSKPFPGLFSNIIIDGNSYNGHLTNLSMVGMVGMEPQKWGTLIILLDKGSHQVSEIQQKLFHHELIFYAHGIDQPQKMYVEEFKICNESTFSSGNPAFSVELTGIIK